MKVLLAKCHNKTIYSRVEPIVTEPLELEYLAAVLDSLKIDYRIYDSLMERESFEEVFQDYKPNVLVLSGYITAVNRIIEWSKFAKRKTKDVKILVGGVHAEVNYMDFFVDTIDIIVHSDGINTFKKLLESNFKKDSLEAIEGLAFKYKEEWTVNRKIETCLVNMPLPNRDYFEKHRRRTKYLHYSPIAIVKTALSCPHNCNFCYCKLLNNGKYSLRSIDSIIEEIDEIDSEYIWIVDDSFLISRERVLEFIDGVKSKGINKRFIAYSRVDFIANNEDLILKLAEVGFVELIVGMEAVEDEMLNNFNKNCSAQENVNTVDNLRKYGIQLTALFIVGIDFKYSDFKNMRSWIRKMNLKSYTASIFTPMKGTEIYKDYESKILTTDYSKWDFLHLTMKPVHMNSLAFYFQFYLIYVEEFFRSKYIRSYIFKSWRHILSLGGRNE